MSGSHESTFMDTTYTNTQGPHCDKHQKCIIHATTQKGAQNKIHSCARTSLRHTPSCIKYNITQKR